MYIPGIVRLEGPGGQEVKGEWKVKNIKYENGTITAITLAPLAPFKK
jgi:hypothetical protein